MSRKTRQQNITEALGVSQVASFENFTRNASTQIQSTLSDLKASNDRVLERLNSVEKIISDMELKVKDTTLELSDMKASDQFHQGTVKDLA